MSWNPTIEELSGYGPGIELVKVLSSYQLAEDGVIPKWYGVAYRTSSNHFIVCYPIPLNLIVRWGMDLIWWLKIPPLRAYLECQQIAWWEAGYDRGYQRGRFERQQRGFVLQTLAEMKEKVVSH